MAIIDPLLDPFNLIISFFLSFSPVIILFLPYLLTRRKNENFIAILYNRAYIGFFVFYLAYFIFPSILNFLVPNPTGYLNKEYYSVPGTNQWTTVWDSAAVVRFGLIYLPVPLLIKYLIGHFVNSIIIYLTYPVVILAFVFGISPLISMLILLYQTWGEKRREKRPILRLIKQNNDEIQSLRKKIGKSPENEVSELQMQLNEIEKEKSELMMQLQEIQTVKSRLKDIQYEMESSPFQEVIKRVKEKNWDNEKELLKILIAILPITLFLLMTILQLLGEEENPSLLQGTSMGWFLEIFFAYIAMIVFSVYLIKASRLSRKGKFLGNQLYIAMVQSLSTVGAFMSGLAVILFLLNYFQQIFVISYFVVYFIMVSFFFVLFLDIFEPFSVYLLIKFIETSKNVRQAFKRINFKNTFYSLSTGVVVGFLLAIGFFTYRVFIASVFINWETVQYETFFWLTQNYTSFLLAAILILFIRRWNWSIIGTAIVSYISLILVSIIIFGWYTNHWYTLLGFNVADLFPNFNGFVLIEPFTTVTSIFAGIIESKDLFWLTSIFKEGMFNEIHFIIPELTQIPVEWKGTGGTFLGILSIPYNLLHPLAIIMTWGSILFLAGRKFLVEIQRGDETGNEKIHYKAIYSEINSLPTLGELIKKSDIILIELVQPIDPNLETKLKNALIKVDRGEEIFNAISKGKIRVGNISGQYQIELKHFHHVLDELEFEYEIPLNKILKIYYREFAYSYEEVTIDSLHVMMLDGRAVLSHTFGDQSKVEPALVAGLFSAITSFAKEAVRSEQLLKTIDHGDVVLTIEYQKHVFAAIFADSTSSELRRKLTDFLGNFEARYAKVLPAWLGNLDIFEGEEKLIESLFSV
ncbi:hypothetical protein [Candidatus Hodarchaeum mangrovi]